MSSGLRLPDELRGFFSKPHGKLYTGKGLDTVEKIENLRESSPLICVGDLVSYYTFKAGYRPDMVVIDFKTVRDKLSADIVGEMKSFLDSYLTFSVQNPPAMITYDLVKVLVDGVKAMEQGNKVCIYVTGEEDLATMPLTYLLPYDSLILYGQPGEGVVALKVTHEKKILILELLRRMERLENGEEVINLIISEGVSEKIN
jgi:hypothetical protein